MTNRELLEYAAKAAGGQVRFDLSPDGAPWFQSVVAGKPQPYPVRWNPRTDSGQALELAVKLGLSVCNSPRIGSSWVCNEHGRNIAEVVHDDAVSFDPLAATRRAIVCAVAEIGKEMP